MQMSIFQRITNGESIHLDNEEFMKLKVHCSSVFNSLKQWLSLAMTIYKTDVEQCLDLLLYVEKHEIGRSNYRDHTNNNQKIQIYNCLASLYLCKNNKATNAEEKGKIFDNAIKYINLAEKAKMPSGKTPLVLRGFIHFYEGSIVQSIGSFNRAMETNLGDEEPQSVIGMLGLAQVFFAKRNYEAALNQYKKALKTNKSLPAKARLGMAFCFYELQKYQMAKFCFKRLLDLEPNCIQAIMGLATIGYFEGKKDEYFRAIQKCYQLNHNHPLVLLHLAEHLLLSQATTNLPSVVEKGLEEIKKLATFKDPTQDLRNDQIILKCKFHHLLAQMYHQQGQYESCLKHYNLALNKNLLYVKINLAQAYINPCNYLQAIKLLEQVFKNIPPRSKKLLNQVYKTLAYLRSKVSIKKDRSQINEAIQYYTQSLKYNNNDYQAYIQCANCLLEMDPKRSQQYYRSAYQILLNQGKFIQPQLLNNIGVLKLQKKEQAEAQQFINRALSQVQIWLKESTEDQQIKQIKQKAYKATFYFNMAIIHEESYKFLDAIECYNKIIQINPLYLDAYIRLAFLYVKRGDNSKALEYLNNGEALAVEAKNKYISKDKILLARAYIFKMIGDQRKAREILKQCLNQPYKKILDQSLQYDILIQRGDSNTRNLREILKQKVRPGLKILEEDPYNLYGIMYFGVLAATLQKPREAIICLNALKQMDSQHPKVLLNLGIYYYKIEQYDTSLMIMKKYVDKISNSDITAQLTICFILVVKNRFEEAIKIVKKLIMLNPENIMLRYHLAFFTQRLSQKYLDSEKRETKKIAHAITYIKRIKTMYAFFSRIKPQIYISCLENPEVMERTKEQLVKIKEKSDDQKMYIKSREERFAFYERDAQNKEKIALQEKMKIINRAKEARQKQQRMIQQQQRLKQLEQQKRRERLQKQKQLEEILNNQYLQDQLELNKGKEQRKYRQGKGGKKAISKKKKDDDYDDFIEPDPEENQVQRDNERQLMEQVPRRQGGRLKKKKRRDSSSEQDRMPQRQMQQEKEEEKRMQVEEGQAQIPKEGDGAENIPQKQLQVQQ